MVGYKHLGDEFPHASVDHAKGEYVRSVAYYEKDAVVVGAVHTNTIEGFWSIFKRGIVGSFHKVSRKYMPLYVAEFQFRYNNRGNVRTSSEWRSEGASLNVKNIPNASQTTTNSKAPT
jgi:hypothetical protein